MRTVLASTLAVVLGWGTVVLAGPFSMPGLKPAAKEQPVAAKPVITRTAHQQPAGGVPLFDAAAELPPAPAAPEKVAAPAPAAPAAPVVVKMKGDACCAACEPCCKPARAARPKRNCFECGDYCEIVKLWLWEIGQCFQSGCGK